MALNLIATPALKTLVVALLVYCALGCHSSKSLPEPSTYVRFKNTTSDPVRTAKVHSEIDGVTFTDIAPGVTTEYHPLRNRDCFGFVELHWDSGEPMILHASARHRARRGHFTYTLVSHRADLDVIDVVVTKDRVTEHRLEGR